MFLINKNIHEFLKIRMVLSGCNDHFLSEDIFCCSRPLQAVDCPEGILSKAKKSRSDLAKRPGGATRGKIEEQSDLNLRPSQRPCLEVGAKPRPSKRSARQPSFGEASRRFLDVVKKIVTCQKGGCRAPQAHRRTLRYR